MTTTFRLVRDHYIKSLKEQGLHEMAQLVICIQNESAFLFFLRTYYDPVVAIGILYTIMEEVLDQWIDAAKPEWLRDNQGRTGA